MTSDFLSKSQSAKKTTKEEGLKELRDKAQSIFHEVLFNFIITRYQPY